MTTRFTVRAGTRASTLLFPALLAACESVGPGPVEAPVVTSVEIVAEGTLDLPWNGTVTLRAIARDATGDVVPGRGVSWTSEDPAVAIVTGGVVQARGPGAARVGGEVDGVIGTARVRVLEAPITSIRVTGPTALARGTVVAWGAVPIRADGREAAAPVWWSSSDARVATVTTGPLGVAMVAAHVEGDAVVTAHAAETTVSIPVLVR